MYEYFQTLQKLLDESRIVIDRPKGSVHPKFPDYIYPLDYGYLEGTMSQDGGGIDVWVGSNDPSQISGIIVIVDPIKKDSEIKILLGCNEAEGQLALESNNRGEMKAFIIKKELRHEI